MATDCLHRKILNASNHNLYQNVKVISLFFSVRCPDLNCFLALFSEKDMLSFSLRSLNIPEA
jgi:hypothetical protein